MKNIPTTEELELQHFAEDADDPDVQAAMASPQPVRKCCASCDCWRAEIMECKYAPGEAAPPEAGCDGWIKGCGSHWLAYARKLSSPNT